MRITWLEGDVIRAARSALSPPDGDWEDLFEPVFELPPAPAGVPDDEWPHIAEHVARAERVSLAVRQHGFHGACQAFGDSRHAVELATLVAAAVQCEELDLDLLESLLDCEIDELLTYGTFLTLLVEVGTARDLGRMVKTYERFTEAALDRTGESPLWQERVDAIRDGLANVYVIAGHYEEAHELYQRRHREAQDDLVVALAAARAFLASGNVARAVLWLGIGADRAADLGRDRMEAKLREKQQNLRKRMS